MLIYSVERMELPTEPSRSQVPLPCIANGPRVQPSMRSSLIFLCSYECPNNKLGLCVFSGSLYERCRSGFQHLLQSQCVWFSLPKCSAYSLLGFLRVSDMILIWNNEDLLSILWR